MLSAYGILDTYRWQLSNHFTCPKAQFGTVDSVSATRISEMRLQPRFSLFGGRTLKPQFFLRFVVVQHVVNTGRLAGVFCFFSQTRRGS